MGQANGVRPKNVNRDRGRFQAVSRHRFPPVPEVGNRRSMVHVSDVIRAAVLAAEHPSAVGEVFIVSDGQTYSTRQMYDLMCRALGRTPSRWNVPLWGTIRRGLPVTC